MNKNFKKKWPAMVFAAIIIIGMIMMLITPLFAAELTVSEGASLSSSPVPLDTENTGILPTSPFYFLKEWTRAVGLVFTFNSVSKAQYELDIEKGKAAELQKIEELDPKNSEAIKTAVNNYNNSAVKLKVSLGKIKNVASDAKLDSLLSSVAVSAVQQKDLLNNLEANHFDLKNNLQEAKQAVSDILLIAPHLK